MEKTIITSRIEGTAHEALKALARRQERSVSWLVRKAVDRYLKAQATSQPPLKGQEK